MFKRLKRLWDLTNIELEVAKDGKSAHMLYKPEGEGKAEFLPDMTEEELEKHERDELKGWSKFWGKL